MSEPSVHERALTAPSHWAPLSEAMLRQKPGSLSAEAAATHLEAAAAACKLAFKIAQQSPWLGRSLTAVGGGGSSGRPLGAPPPVGEGGAAPAAPFGCSGTCSSWPGASPAAVGVRRTPPQPSPQLMPPSAFVLRGWCALDYLE